MDNTVKTLIIVVIILVGVLGVAGGVFLQSNLTNNKNVAQIDQSDVNQSNSTSNNTTSTAGKQNYKVNISTNNQTTQIESKLISEADAIKIVQDNIGTNGDVNSGATLVNNGKHQYYTVLFSDNEGFENEMYVDAKTGKILTAGELNA